MIEKRGSYTLDRQKGKTVITHPDKMGKIVVYGNGHEHEIFYAIPDWSDEEESAFEYKGETYFLSEFMRIDRNAPEWMQDYDGYSSDSFFSGILIKYADDYGDFVRVYTYIC